jgi:hypothetical protein
LGGPTLGRRHRQQLMGIEYDHQAVRYTLGSSHESQHPEGNR